MAALEGLPPAGGWGKSGPRQVRAGRAELLSTASSSTARIRGSLADAGGPSFQQSQILKEPVLIGAVEHGEVVTAYDHR